MSKVRFIHASDLHLDASFGGVDVTDDMVAGAFARSTLEALDRVVALCIEREADFLVIAGDLYNSSDRSLRAELAFQRAMRRLAEKGIGAYVVQGNHDPADGWSAGLELPDSVVVFSSQKVERREVLREGKLVCAVYGRSYPTRQVTDNLAHEFRRLPDDPLAVAVLHANVGHRVAWDNYAPCSIEDLRRAGMDYWALGHVHVPGRISDNPVAVYSGSTQGLDPTEDGARGCFVVDLDESGAREEFVETASIRWKQLEIETADRDDLDSLRRSVTAVCESVRRSSGGRPAVLRADLVGRSAVHSALARPGVLEDLMIELREAQLAVEPWIWIDRLRDRTRPAIDVEAVASEEGLRGDLVRLATNWAEDAAHAEQVVHDVLRPVVEQLSARSDLQIEPQQVIRQACDLCLDLLSGDDA